MKKYNYDRFKTSDYDLATFNGPKAGEQDFLLLLGFYYWFTRIDAATSQSR